MSEQKQYGEFNASVIQGLPELTKAQLQIGIRDRARVQKFLLGLLEVLKDTFTLKATIDRDMTGWECKEPVKAEGEFELVLQDFLGKGESYLGGEEMVKRAKDFGTASGLKHLEAMLREQDKIPAEMRQFCLVSTEVWVAPDGDRSVWYLYWDGGRWVLDADWLSGNFSSSNRLVSPRKYQKQS